MWRFYRLGGHLVIREVGQYHCLFYFMGAAGNPLGAPAVIE
jgi:hypothetical protein